jgi:hypothetical protein
MGEFPHAWPPNITGLDQSSTASYAPHYTRDRGWGLEQVLFLGEEEDKTQEDINAEARRRKGEQGKDE